MAAFNFFSHGTQDLYPTFLQKQRGFSPGAVSALAIIYNLGAIARRPVLRRRSRSASAAGAPSSSPRCSALPMIPLWVLQPAVLLAAGAFALQFMVQGAWGMVPAHLNELSPPSRAGTFPGLAYQLGNLLAAATPPCRRYRRPPQG